MAEPAQSHSWRSRQRRRSWILARLGTAIAGAGTRGRARNLPRPSAANSPYKYTTGRTLLLPGPGKKKRSEEHTSELQSPDHLVCRLLLEKKKPLLLPADAYTVFPDAPRPTR